MASWRGRVLITVGAINFDDPWAIGAGSADGFSRFFVGNICQVAMYTNSLTPAQVKTHYYSGLFGVTSINSSIPLIVLQPQSQAVYPGGSATFSVTYVSASATTNQWLKNGVALAGQTNTTLTVSDVLTGQLGNYSVIVGNANGVTNSTPASLSILSSGNSLQWTANGNNGVLGYGHFRELAQSVEQRANGFLIPATRSCLTTRWGCRPRSPSTAPFRRAASR